MFLIVWGWFYRSFSSLVCLHYISPFNICCKAGLVVLNSLNFCLSEKLFISPSILNEIIVRYSDLGCRFFPFSTLKISCHSLLACRVSAERSAANHMGFPLYVTCCFSLLLLTFFLWVWSLLVWLSCVLACFSLCVSCMGLCASWTWLTISFSMLGKFSTIILQKFSHTLSFSLLLWPL